jgi:hypothetical protein
MIIAVTTKSRTQMKIPMKEKVKKEKETRRLFVKASPAGLTPTNGIGQKKKGRPCRERPQVTEECDT